MKARANLIARDDAPDCSDFYGEEWHAPLPHLKLGMSVKIGVRGDDLDEYPWAVITRILDQRIWVHVERTDYPEVHGVSSDDVLEIRPEHIHLAESGTSSPLQ